jgi:hypothetical protein
MGKCNFDGADAILCHYRKLGDVAELRDTGKAKRAWVCYRARYDSILWYDEVVVLRKYGEDDFTYTKYDYVPEKYRNVIFGFKTFEPKRPYEI